MSRSLFVGLFAFFLLSPIPSYGSDAKKLVQNFEFAPQRKGKEWQGEWQKVPGLPEIPVVHARVVLPYQRKFKSAKFEPKERGELREAVEIRMAPIPKTLCESKWDYGKGDRKFTAAEFYPESFQGEAQEQTLHGYRIVILPLYPMRVIPASKEGIFISAGELTIETEPDEGETLFRGKRADRNEVEAIVTNPDTLKGYPLAMEQRGSEYLAIAPQAFIEDQEPYNLKSLLQEKESRAITTKMLSLEDVTSQYPGRDIQEKVRNAIIAHYKKEGTRYVLLVGNGHSILPTRKLNVNISEGTLYSDFYFACLDGDFDGNHNNVFGEPNDGLNGKDVDLACEVAVGRAPVTTKGDLHAFVKKTLAMEHIAFFDARIWNTISFGEKLDSATLGSKLLDQLEKGGTAGPLSTTGYPAAAKFKKLHETFTKEFVASEVIAALKNSEAYTVNHLGHANESYCMRIDDSRIPEITNELPFFAITQGCHPGNLKGPNWASKLVVSDVGGAGAMVANSNYGFYDGQGSNDGPSNHYHLAFYDTVFRDGIRNLGWVHYKAKTKMIPEVTSSPIMRWIVYETNLLGDPELELRF